jgi:carboxypeptidase family protein
MIPQNAVIRNCNRGSVIANLQLTTLACSLLLAAFSCASSSASVEVQPPLKSSPNVQLTVFLKGAPQEGVRVKIYRYESAIGQEPKPRFSLLSDRNGRVFARKLATGHYHVVASASKNLIAELSLEVSSRPDSKPSEFSMELHDGGITREEFFSKLDQQPIHERVSVFRGVIRDPSGGPIPGALIEVVRKGSQGKDRVTHLKSGKRGQFSGALSEGSYIVSFSEQGFRTQFVPLQVTKQGSAELTVTLEPGPST